jgi:hypothetical protein
MVFFVKRPSRKIINSLSLQRWKKVWTASKTVNTSLFTSTFLGRTFRKEERTWKQEHGSNDKERS